MVRNYSKVCALLVCLVLLAACGNIVANTPGSLNTFDATAYRSLIDAQAALTQAKTTITPTTPQIVKDVLNKAIASYNTASDAYKVYHTALVNHGVPDQGSLQVQITALISDIATLTTTLKGGK